MNLFFVQDFLENSAARVPNTTALVCGDQRLTYQQINDSANRLGAALVDMGIGRQDRVIIFLDNSPECVISLFGVLKAGAIFVILNPTMKSKKLNYILRDSGARAIITDGNKLKIINEAINETSALRHIIWIEKLNPSFTRDRSDIVQSTWGDLFSRGQSSRLW